MCCRIKSRARFYYELRHSFMYMTRHRAYIAVSPNGRLDGVGLKKSVAQPVIKMLYNQITLTDNALYKNLPLYDNVSQAINMIFHLLSNQKDKTCLRSNAFSLCTKLTMKNCNSSVARQHDIHVICPYVVFVVA